MEMIVDLIILGIIVLCVFIGKKKGLMSCLIGIFSIVISIVLSLLLYSPVENFLIQNTEIDDNIKKSISVQIISESKETEDNSSEEIVKVKEGSKLPDILKKYVNDANNKIEKTKADIVETVASELTMKIMSLIAFLIVFIIVRIILIVIKVISNIITKLPVIKQLNDVGGIVCGLLQGILIVYVAFAVISLVSPAIKNDFILSNINKAYVGSRMYNNNLIVKYLVLKH